MICALRIVSGPGRGRRCFVETEQNVQVGRIQSSGFSIPEDKHLSRRHFEVEGTSSGDFRIRDVGSSNGTFVNGQRVQSQRLSDGDSLRAGISVFQVFLVERAEDLPAFKEEIGESFPINSLPDDATTRISDPFEEPAPRKFGVHPGSMEREFGPMTRVYDPREEAMSLFQDAVSIDEAFQKTAHPFVLETDKSPRNPAFILSVITKLEADFELRLTVNREQLNATATEKLSLLIEHHSAIPLSQSIFAVEGCREVPLHDFLLDTLNVDGMIIIGFKKGSSSMIGLLREEASFLSYPSMLYGILKEPEDPQFESFLSKIGFLLFEKGVDDSWCLVLSPSIQNYMKSKP